MTIDDLRSKSQLTRKQIRCLALYAGSDLTLSEIGRKLGIKRRCGVHRVVARANAKLVEAGLPAIRRNRVKALRVDLSHIGQAVTPSGRAVQV